jgi:holo-[acyl-carrier protein] synthase
LTESEKKSEKKLSRFKNVSTIAKRFAAKEAISKAIGYGFSNGIHFKDIEIYNDKSGKPYANLNGKAKTIVNKISKKYNIFLTLSDDKPWAVATALITSE